MTTPDRDFWVSNKHHVEYLVGELVGFPVEVYWGASSFTGVGRSGSYQIMPREDAEEARSVFWDWHLGNNEQWFLTPLEAAVTFVRAWRQWVTESGG